VTDTLKRERSFAQVPDTLILDHRLSHLAVRLWCRLDRYAGANGRTIPSRARLARDLDVSQPTITRALTNLTETGWISRAPEFPGSSTWNTTLHERPRKPASRMTRPRITGDPAPHQERCAEGEACEGESGEGQGGQGAAPTSLADLVEGSTEPPLRCPRHADVAQPPKCGPCGDARRTHDAWKKAHPDAGRESTTDIMLGWQALKSSPTAALLAIEAGAA
jgi:DNA-binding transcriptional ArsR family regulator